MNNFAHPGHPHVDGATHVSAGNSLVPIILLSLVVIVMTCLIIYKIKSKK